MLTAKNRFKNNISRIRNTNDLHSHLKNRLNFQDAYISDISRSELVFLISSLDRFIHDIVKAGMIKIFQGLRPVTSSYLNFSIPLIQLDSIRNSIQVPPELIFEQQIIKSHKHLAFQEPDNITSALSLIWNEPHKWHKIAQKIGMNENDVKVKLKNIVLRRHQIVHEADMDLLTGTIQTIVHSDIESSIEFINGLCIGIYELII